MTQVGSRGNEVSYPYSVVGCLQVRDLIVEGMVDGQLVLAIPRELRLVLAGLLR